MEGQRVNKLLQISVSRNLTYAPIWKPKVFLALERLLPCNARQYCALVPRRLFNFQGAVLTLDSFLLKLDATLDLQITFEMNTPYCFYLALR